jgi:voltage-gated potassium channel
MIYNRLLGVLIALSVVILAGVLGYRLIEGWNLFDSLYMTIITIASVGFGEVHELTFHGRIFTIILILCGSVTMIYGVSILTAFIVEGELTDALRRRKMKNAIAKLENHYILCGMSSTGKYIAGELAKTGHTFVVIEMDPQKIRGLTDSNILNIEGDATHEAVLESANIGRAGGLLTALHNDSDNLFVVVTAKGLNPQLKIVAKAINEESERKLRQVGADYVVMPNFIGGMRMASEMLRPSVVSFLDNMLRSKDATVRVEEIHLSPNSPLLNKSLNNSGVLDVGGVTVVALSDGKGSYEFNPHRDRILGEDDVIIVMGVVEKILILQQKAAA